MKKTREQKGITLIALIITIIVLLILAVVTIGAIKNDGIIQYARNAKSDYITEANKEQETLNTLEGQIGAALGKENSKGGITWKDNKDGTFTASNGTKVAIGDYVNYTYDTVSTGYPLAKAYSGYSDQTITQRTGLQWRVMGINDNGELELICATPAKSKTVYFEDATGYNNGVYLLNDMCEKLYSNTELGIKARSLTIEDIEERFSDAGKSARDGYTNSSSGVQYGKTKTYGSGDNMYPTLYAEEANSGVSGSIREGGITGSDPYYTSTSKLSVAYDSSGNAVSTSEATASGNLMTTQTDYSWSSTPASYFDNETFRNMIFGTGTYYWLASRYVNCSSSYAIFGLRYVGYADLFCFYLFSSGGNSNYDDGYLRPVVSLGSNVNLTTNEEANSATNMWILSK